MYRTVSYKGLLVPCSFEATRVLALIGCYHYHVTTDVPHGIQACTAYKNRQNLMTFASSKQLPERLKLGNNIFTVEYILTNFLAMYSIMSV